MSTAVDYSKSLAALLRESTIEAHDQVSLSDGAKRLTSGQLSKESYIQYLMMLWHIYDALEGALERLAAHPTLEPTYNPALLARAPSLSADISHLLQVDESSWKTHPIHVKLLASAPEPLTAYVQRIKELSDLSDPSPLLAHSYVRYMGDLSGGQTIRHILSKAYGLDEAAGFGISFYAFKELRSAKLASLGEMKRIKDWFREGMNKAGEQAAEVKASVVAEAKVAFDLNSDLLSILELEPEEPKDDVRTLYPIAERTFPVSQIAAIIAAACLAHFIIVVGGFTGEKGYAKLLAIELWARNLWQQFSE